MTATRTCDSCSACCTFLRIDSAPGYSTRLDTGEDIAKNAGVPCRFLLNNRCSIYEQRPVVCRRFTCDWVRGHKDFGDDDAPIKLGYFRVKGNIVNLR